MSNSPSRSRSRIAASGLCLFTFTHPESKGGRSADRRLFVIVVAPASASVGRAGDARVASCEAAPDALAFRRSTVAVARHASLRIRDRLENTPSMSEAANVLAWPRVVVNSHIHNVVETGAAIFGRHTAPLSGTTPRDSIHSSAPEHLSFRFGVRRHRRGYEWPPSVSYRANVGQDLRSLVFGHFALRVGQLVEALLNFRPKLSAADLAVLL